MTRINIDHLSEAELVDLNHRVVERLRLMSQVRAHQAMLEFRIGDRVTFEPPGRAPVVGMLTRYNRKSVTVVTEDGHRWIVAPAVLKLAESRASQKGGDEAEPSATVIPFREISSRGK